MRLRALALVAALAACGHSTPPPTAPLPPTDTAATPPAPAITPVDAARLEQQITPFVQSLGSKLGEKRKLSGFVLVAQQGKPVYQHAFGYADREHQVPADIDTSFRIGSVTKQFTSAAIMVLAQDGKLSVDDPISKYLPDYPSPGRDITLHQLLTHTAGIPNYTEMPDFMAWRLKPHTPSEIIATFWDKPLVFAPGSQYQYSNSNYIVLGAIIEKVSGQSYADFLKTRLFEPAGLTRTVVGDADGMPDRALGYMPKGDAVVPADPIDMTNPYAAGAVRSTAADLVRWAHALDGDAIVNAASKARMYKVEKNDYAYGWIVKDEDGHRVIGHDGGIDGFETMYLRVPDQDLVVVVWSNNMGVHPQPIAEAALSVAMGGTVAPVVEPDVVPLDQAAAARIVGRYKLTDDARQKAAQAGVPAAVLDTIATLEMSIADGHLVFKPVGQDAFALDALSATRYLQLDIGVALEVTLPDQGAASALTLTQGGLSLAYVRDEQPPAKAPAPPAKKKHK